MPQVQLHEQPYLREYSLDPQQLRTNLAQSDSTNNGKAIKLDRALTPVSQLNMDVGKQVITGVHHNARSREFVDGRHGWMLVQQLHYVNADAVIPGADADPNPSLLIPWDASSRRP